MKSAIGLLRILLVMGILCLSPRANAGIEEVKKLLSLIEVVNKTDCEVLYNGRTFDCKFVSRFAKVFLATHYNGETAEEWVDKWCYRSFNGSIVWVREQEKYKIASKRLKEELKNQHD